ncbi:MAG: cyanophycinase [Candidatus Acidiferrales bacterium]
MMAKRRRALGMAVCLCMTTGAAVATPKSESATTSAAVQAQKTIGPEKGYLVLQGGGASVAEIFQRFVALAGGAKANIVLIPTAAASGLPGNVIPAGRLERMRTEMAQRLGVANVTVLHTLDRKLANSADFAEPLRHATGVWLLGGDEELLAKTYHGTRTEQELDALVARGGVVGGTSAGADICAPFVFFTPQGKEAVPLDDFADYLKPDGFGLLRQAVILPHFAQRHLEVAPPKVLAIHPEALVIGIDEATAIIVHGNRFEVVGQGSVEVYDKAHAGGNRTLLKNGQWFDLASRAIVAGA